MAEPRQHFNVLDIFRGIFASMIVFFHLRTYTTTRVLNNDFIANASLFVNFFFVLSGFVIAYNYQHIDKLKLAVDFFKKRFLRLYPLHLFLLIVFLVYFFFKKIFVIYFHYTFLFADDNWKTFVCSLFLIQSIKFQGFNESLSWNYPSWSISAEMITYIFFGLSELFFFSVGLKRVRIYFYILIVLFSIISFFYNNQAYQWMNGYDNGVLYGLFGFYFGVICSSIYTACSRYCLSLNKYFLSLCEVVLLVCLVFMVSAKNFLLPLFGLWLYNVYFLVTIFIFSLQKGFISALLVRSSILKKIGDYSYSIYMNHLIVILLFNFILTRIFKLSPAYYSVLFILVYYLVYLLSGWTYKHIEMRFYKKRDKVKAF